MSDEVNPAENYQVIKLEESPLPTNDANEEEREICVEKGNKQPTVSKKTE